MLAALALVEKRYCVVLVQWLYWKQNVIPVPQRRKQKKYRYEVDDILDIVMLYKTIINFYPKLNTF